MVLIRLCCFAVWSGPLLFAFPAKTHFVIARLIYIKAPLLIENERMTIAIIEDPDQPAHVRSLIRVYTSLTHYPYT